MLDAVEITLVRHGESEANVAELWQGQGDSELSPRGEAQALALAERLHDEHFDLTISSDLKRARNTAAKVCSEFEQDPAWREMDVGGWEGLNMSQVLEKFPDEIEALRRKEQVQIGGGESWAELFVRADAALNRARAKLKPGQRGIIFTHGAVITSLLAGAIDKREDFPAPLGRMRNSAMSTLRFSEGRVEIVRHNDATHALASQLQSPSRMQQRAPQLFVYASTSTDSALPQGFTAYRDLRGMEPQHSHEPFHTSLSKLSAKEASAGRVLLALGKAEVAHHTTALLELDRTTTSFAHPEDGHLCRIQAQDERAVIVDYNVPLISGVP